MKSPPLIQPRVPLDATISISGVLQELGVDCEVSEGEVRTKGLRANVALMILDGPKISVRALDGPSRGRVRYLPDSVCNSPQDFKSGLEELVNQLR